MSTCMHLLHFVTCVVLSEPCRFELLSYTSFKVQVQDGQLLGHLIYIYRHLMAFAMSWHG